MSKKNKQSAILGKMSKKHYTVFGAAILAVGVLHFLMQMTFIQGEHRRIVENTVKTAPTVDPMPEVKPQELVIETQTATTESVKPDRIDVPKPVVVQKDLIPQKVNLADTARPESEAQVSPAKSKSKDNERKNSVKKKVVREANHERLRRAEQILTGF